MSDFASLLSQLDQSAKKPAEENKRRQQHEEKHLKKRWRKGEKEPQKHDNNSRRCVDSRKRPRTSTLSKPHDAPELTIQLAFLCIGAQKAGTSWLHEMLRKIPSLGLPEQKELHFWDWHRRKGFAWYSRQFPKSDIPLLYGEITPCYMTLPEEDVREIHTLFPEMRIVFIARDFVDRAWSALTMELRNSVQGMTAGQFSNDKTYQTLDITTQNRIDKESDPNQQTDDYFMNRLEHSTHTQRSDYAAGLRQWLKYFSPEQILIVNYEDISEDPKGVMEKVLKHVGVKKDAVNELSTEELQQKVNVAAKPRPIRSSLRQQMKTYLQPQAREFNKLLSELGYEWTLDEYS